jgi:hypothetical protein
MWHKAGYHSRATQCISPSYLDVEQDLKDVKKRKPMNTHKDSGLFPIQHLYSVFCRRINRVRENL